MPRLPILLVSAAAIILTGVLAWFVAPDVASRKPVIRTSGEALIGGAFDLTDHRGNPVTQTVLEDKLSIVVFGFTFCPDICPTELSTISAAFDTLEDDLGKLPEGVKAYFITIDPERDTVEQMASYMSNFHPRITGLTGTPEQIKQAARAYRVYYARIEDPESSAGYTMDHSTLMFLMSGASGYIDHFSYGTTADAIAATLKENLG